MTTLVQTGMIHVAKGTEQRYTIGLTAYRIGINYTNNLDFIGTIDPVLKAFAERWERPCSLECAQMTPLFTSANLSRKIPLSLRPLLEPKTHLLYILGKAIMAYTEDEADAGVVPDQLFKNHTGWNHLHQGRI